MLGAELKTQSLKLRETFTAAGAPDDLAVKVTNTFDLDDPSEWFVVPYDVINQAVTMIMSGEITNYVYDKTERRLVERDR